MTVYRSRNRNLWLAFFVICTCAAAQDYEKQLATIPQDSVEAARVLLDLSSELYAKTDYAGAKTRAQQALTIYRQVYGDRHPSVAQALNGVAVAMLGAGEYQGATPLFQQALEISRAANGTETHETVSIMERFARNLTRAGEYARAKILEEEALSIAERRFDRDDTLTATLLNDMAVLLGEMGDHPNAQLYEIRGLAILERRSGKDGVPVGDMLIAMGNNAREAADYLHAKAYFERAAAIYELGLGPHNTRLGGALDSLGQSLVDMRHFTEARPILERAVAIQTQELGERHPWTANVLQSLGKLEAGLGNYDKALDYYHRNLAIWQEVLGPEHPFTVASMTQIGDILGHLGQFPEALEITRKAVAIRRDDIIRTVRTVDERQALRYAALDDPAMDTMLTIASRTEASRQEREQVWDTLIRTRALVLDEMSARHRSIRQSGDPEVAQSAQSVAAARDRVTKLVLQGPGKLPLAQYNLRLAATRGEWERASTQLAVKSAGFRQEWTYQRTGYAEVRQALPADSALVAFRRYSRQNYRAAGGASTDSYLAFVLAGSGSEPMVIPLGPAAEIEKLTAQWRAEIGRERGSLGRSAQINETRYRAAAATLRQAIWDPITRHLGKTARVYIVPDGALQLVNFDSLPSQDGRYLVEAGPLLHILSTERDLAMPAATVTGTELLAVADPQFQSIPTHSAGTAATAGLRGEPGTCADFASLQFPALPGSLLEAESILKIWRGEGWHGSMLTGSDATEASLKKMVAGKRVVHIATHGFFLDAQCPGSSVGRENPLLRAGLALAGAKQRQNATANQDDGILTAEEAGSLDLEGVEWVVLSGCDTAAGDVRAGEGVLGLRRAFQEAGAHTLIASLWPVDDRAVRHWMGTLYRAHFHDGKGAAEAVRDADVTQLRALRQAAKSTHPFYWAGFVAVGDWR